MKAALPALSSVVVKYVMDLRSRKCRRNCKSKGKVTLLHDKKHTKKRTFRAAFSYPGNGWEHAVFFESLSFDPQKTAH